MTADSTQAVVRLRTLGPSGLNPPQTEVIDRLQTFTAQKDSPIADLDVDVWGASMGIAQTENRDLVDTRETVAEFKQWADEHDCTLHPAFEWRSADSTDNGEGRIVTPLITLAVYTRESLQAVYPHVDGNEVDTIHDGIEALELRTGTGDAEQSEDEQCKNLAASLP